jgi:hypothetical protein
MIFEVACQCLLPALLTLSISAAVTRAIVINPTYAVRYVVMIGLMAVLHCLYAMWRNRDVRFLAFIAYGFLHAALLIPIRLRAVGTLTDNSWGTRQAVSRG